VANDSPYYRAVLYGCKNHLKLPPEVTEPRGVAVMLKRDRATGRSAKAGQRLKLLWATSAAKAGLWWPWWAAPATLACAASEVTALVPYDA
jgi:hypothetical protein